MSFDARLTHEVAIVRRFDLAADDEYGQPTTSETTLTTVRAAIQPKSQDEQALTSQAGVALSDHVIFMRPTDITTADHILHDEAACPQVSDLPTTRYEIVGTPNAAGLGHHLELEAKLVGSPEFAEVAS